MGPTMYLQAPRSREAFVEWCDRGMRAARYSACGPTGTDPAAVKIVVTRAWATIRFTAGMTILTLVFMVSQGLVLVHDLTHGAGATGQP
jgi:hypothetical protein